MKTIHINGKDYIEIAETKENFGCDKCAFSDWLGCEYINEQSKKVFGGNCLDRNVFYGMGE